jgi:tripartite-type tricarboxylate transporter receptor subunit TctC
MARLLVTLLIGFAGICCAQAQSFPTKPVRIIVPFPPGGGADIIARIYAQRLAEGWKQQVVVDNRSGAAGAIGTDIAAKAPPDGYTLYLGTMGTFTVNPSLYAKLPFDIARDFAPLTHLVDVHFVMVTHPSLPARNVKELIALAKARPGQINFSSSGGGGAPHLAGELLKRVAQINLVHVPYKGSGPSFADLLGGHVQLTFDSLVQALPYIKAGRLRALAVLGPSRSPLLPDVPTMKEAGVAGYELTNWFGMAAPAGTPKDILNQIYADFARISKTSEMRERMLGMGAEPIASPPDVFAALIEADTAKWARIVKEAGIKAE